MPFLDIDENIVKVGKDLEDEFNSVFEFHGNLADYMRQVSKDVLQFIVELDTLLNVMNQI